MNIIHATHYDGRSEHIFSRFANHQISDIRSHIQWAVNMVTEYDHFNLPQGIVSVCVLVNI